MLLICSRVLTAELRSGNGAEWREGLQGSAVVGVRGDDTQGERVDS